MLCIISVVVVLLTSCHDKVICPAFQSTYILDDSTRLAFYSSVWKLDEATRTQYLAQLSQELDSGATGQAVASSSSMVPYFTYIEQYVLPAERVRRNKNGMVKYEPNWLRNYNMKKAPMENVLGPTKDIDEGPVDVGEFVADDFTTDSLQLDSAAVAGFGMDSLAADVPEKIAEADPPKGPKYLYRFDPDDNHNVEQEYYIKYFGNQLVARPERSKKSENVQSKVSSDTTAIDTTSAGVKKGLFGKRKKKQNLIKTAEDELETPPETDPAKLEEEPEEENGNGF